MSFKGEKQFSDESFWISFLKKEVGFEEKHQGLDFFIHIGVPLFFRESRWGLTNKEEIVIIFVK